MAPPSVPGQRWPWWVRGLLLFLPLACLLVAGELAVRVHRGKLLSLQSSRDETLFLLRSAYPASYDALLGYVPKAGFRSRDNTWGTLVTIDGDGLRRHDRAPGGVARCLAAVGDSYTFGDEVNDGESWPAALEKLLERPVLNGGVFGYGMDQMVLRAEQMLARHGCIDTLLISVLPDDVKRCEYSYRFAWKPYFEPVGDTLVLRNVPVPEGKVREPWVVRVAGYSYLADAVLRRIVPGMWLAGPFDVRRVHDQGELVSLRLLERLHARARAAGVRVVLVIQGHPRHDPAPTRRLVARARELDVEIVDLLGAMTTIASARPDMTDRFYHANRWSVWGHMSAEGNAWVAARIAEALARDRTPRPAMDRRAQP